MAGGLDLVVVLRYRKAVTYGFHALLGALGEHDTSTRYEVRFGESVEETARHIREAGDTRVIVLWSFYSPDAAVLAEELRQIRALADAPTSTIWPGECTPPPRRSRRWTSAGTWRRSARASRPS